MNGQRFIKILFKSTLAFLLSSITAMWIDFYPHRKAEELSSQLAAIEKSILAQIGMKISPSLRIDEVNHEGILVITEVIDGHPAAQAGVRVGDEFQGDIIRGGIVRGGKFEGKRMIKQDVFSLFPDLVRNQGKEVLIDVSREGKLMRLPLKIPTFEFRPDQQNLIKTYYEQRRYRPYEESPKEKTSAEEWLGLLKWAIFFLLYAWIICKFTNAGSLYEKFPVIFVIMFVIVFVMGGGVNFWIRYYKNQGAYPSSGSNSPGFQERHVVVVR